MKNLIYFISFVLLVSSAAGQCPEITGEDIIELDQIFRIKNLPYITSEEEGTQMLDLYLPAPYIDCPEVQLIIAIHGGGFEGGSKDGMRNWGYYFARKGYSVALINYRLQMKSYADIEKYMLLPYLLGEGGSQCEELNEISFDDGLYKIDKAWYFAIQDSRAALAYLQHDMHERGKTIKKLILMGGSAGAISALGLALGDQEEFNSFNPLLEKLYGPIDARSQYTDLPQKSVDAVISVSGGMFNAEYFIGKNDSIPILFLHGGNDMVVPICEDYCYNKERRLYGPLKIAELADSMHLKMPLQMHFWEGEGHKMHSKFRKMNQIGMGDISNWPSAGSTHSKINLYPQNSLLYNCEVVRLSDEITSNEYFIDRDFASSGISIHPIHSDGSFAVNLPNMIGHSVRLRMYDAHGRLVLSKDFARVSESEITIQCNRIENGMYEWHIIDDNNTVVKVRMSLNR